MRKSAAREESGFTLIELLISMTISAALMGVLVTAYILALNGTGNVEKRASDSHDAQLVETYLPADVQSVQGSIPDTAGATASGCATSTGTNVIRMQWVQSTTNDAGVTTSTTYYASYRTLLAGTEWQLVRSYCTAGGTAGITVAAHSLTDPSTTPPSVSLCGDRVTLSLTEKNGYSYTVSASPRNAFGSLPACPPAAVPPSVSLQTLSMYDSNHNGKVDQVVAQFTGAITSSLGSCASASNFTLSAVPSNGTIGTPTVSGSAITLPINEGGGAQDTSVGLFKVSYTSPAGCNAASFASRSPDDRASPVVVNIASTGNGQLVPGDSLIIKFSEAVTAAPLNTTITEADASPFDTLDIAGITSGPVSTGSTGYVPAGGTIIYSATTVTAGPTVTVTAVACSGTCPATTPSNGALTFSPASSIIDPFGNQATGVYTTASNFKLF